MKFHLIGVGGAGMSVVAELLLAEGHEVHGSDRAKSANIERLADAGARVFVGHDADNLDPDAIVVVSSAIKESNPELARARQRGQRVIHRSQALALAAGERDFVAVAGAHGKTSTSAMIAVALEELGREPSWAVGSTLQGGASGGHLGSGTVLVAEADESDGSFLNYTPRVALVTNVEPDHLDHYGSRENFEQAFVDFAHTIVPGGLLVACSDNPGSLALAKQAAADGIRVWTYGRQFSDVGENQAQLRDTKNTDGRATGVVSLASDATQVPLELAVPGAHNLLNATGAWAVGVELGADPAPMARALGTFQGTGRRFELRGVVSDIRVIDDYAHHPTEVAATLETARQVTDGRVIVIFQPHLYSRTQNFAREFAQALGAADLAFVTSVYAAREEPADGVEGNAITDLNAALTYVPDMHDAARAAAHEAQAGDVILTMGAGDVTTLGAEIISILENR